MGKRLKIEKLYTTSYNPIVRKLISGIKWNVIGTMFSKAFILAASIIVSRILGVDKNGEYGIINSTVVMFSTLAGMGLSTTSTRFIAEQKHSDVERCGRVVGMTNIVGAISGVLMAICLFILSPWLAKSLLHNTNVETGLKISSLLLLFNTVSTVQNGTLSGFGNFKIIARINMITGLLCFPIYTICTYLGGVNGLLIGNIIISIYTCILYLIQNKKAYCQHNIKLDFVNSYKETRIMWQISVPAMLCSIMVSPVIWIGNAIITTMDNGYASLGIFNATNQWRSLLTFIPTAIGSVILTVIIANQNEDWLEKINILLGWVIVNCIAIPLLFVPEVIAWFYGIEYQGNSFIISLIFVIMTTCLLAYKEGIARNLISRNLLWLGVLSNFLWGMLFIVSIAFLRTKGAIGISLTYFLSYLISTLVFIPIYIKKNVVRKSLIVSRDILLMWATLTLQMIVILLKTSIWLRVIPMVLSVLALIRVIRYMFKKKVM